ncbi:MAG: response regulator [Desulfobacterales bacterium]|nr:response regulator [Desulfobacterales bacterium]MCP4163901.1 response regulator [Deltaproteobacteria bacterium]
MKRIFKTDTSNYTLYGALFGFLFPIGGTLLECLVCMDGITLKNIISVQSTNHLLWIIDTAPLFLGLFARIGGIRQDKIHNFNRTLEERIIEKTEDLIDVKENLEIALFEAKKAGDAKSEFLANMSHEIRTPMNGVIGMLDLLTATDLNNDQKEFAKAAQQSADALIFLINDILDFSKIEAGKLEMENSSFSLDVTIDSLVDLFGLKASKKKIEFACLVQDDVHLHLKGDPGRLRQILTNLVGNALKFVDNGDIFLKVSSKEYTDNSVTLLFEIKDTGIGIPEDKIDSLFSSFTQVDATTTRRYGGTGLGLAISKQLVELMDGEIGVTSTFKKGSTFWFTAVFQKQKIIYEKIRLPKNIEKTKILLVDDNFTNHEVLGEYLRSMNCPFKSTYSAKEALNELRNNSLSDPYDVALIDMQMPEMSGIELGKMIQKEPYLKKEIIMIMLSSSATRGDAKLIKEAGFVAFLSKPIKRVKLFDCIRTVLSYSKQVLNDPATQLITSYKVEEVKRIQPENSKKYRILLVEDNLINQKVALRMLQKLHHEVVLAENGVEAVELFKEQSFDIVLMDIHMPEMDGVEATKEIRSIENGSQRIPIIALTANAMKGDKERFLAAGMDEYISKPIKQKIINQMFLKIFDGTSNNSPIENL